MSKRWILYPEKSDDIVDQLLINRNMDPKNKDLFLNPDFYKNTFDADLLSNIKTAIKRIKQAIENKEKIGIFADYDADGIPGAAILTKLFNLLNLRTEIYIPTRDEGYGLNEAGIRYLKEQGCSIIITVDLGIVNCEEVKLASKLGIDVIVTDHHEIQKKKLPKHALAIIHPRLEKSKYPNGNLSGGAVAWKLAWAILKNLKGEKYLTYAKWWLDLAAITLVCDHMLLSGDGKNIENRTLVKYGLKILEKTKNIGLQALYELSSINQESISTYTIGFQIGPRINAPGRMDHGAAAYYLLISEDKKEAIEIAKKLNSINLERQKQSDKILKKAKEKLKTEKLEKKKIIMIFGKKWPSGIIGLVAGKLMEEYCRPVVIFREEKGILSGSARSVPKFNIIEAFSKSRKHLLKYGGHKVAAGVSLEKENFSVFYKNLLKIAEPKLRKENFFPKIKIDKEIKINDINFALFGILKKFEPFGMGNPRPVFLMKNVEILSKRMVGKKEKHLKLELSVSSRQLSAIGFNMGEWKDKIKTGDKIDIVFTIDENIWNGKRSLQLKLLDINLR